MSSSASTTISTEMVKKELATVIDPEMSISIVDLGLIRGVLIDDKHIMITMTLTTPACPFIEFIESSIEYALSRFNREVSIRYTFDPPWGIQDISESIRIKKGLI